MMQDVRRELGVDLLEAITSYGLRVDNHETHLIVRRNHDGGAACPPRVRLTRAFFAPASTDGVLSVINVEVRKANAWVPLPGARLDEPLADRLKAAIGLHLCPEKIAARVNVVA